MVDIPDEVPVGDTSVVCFNYKLEGNLCEVGGPPPHTRRTRSRARCPSCFTFPPPSVELKRPCRHQKALAKTYFFKQRAATACSCRILTHATAWAPSRGRNMVPTPPDRSLSACVHRSL
jgi:hypothetical protein